MKLSFGKDMFRTRLKKYETAGLQFWICQFLSFGLRQETHFVPVYFLKYKLDYFILQKIAN